MPNQPPKHVYWAVDFDRCLGNVEVLFDHYVAALNHLHSIDPSEIITARKRVEASKGSFDLIGYLLASGMLEQNELQLVSEEFVRRCADDPAVLMPGWQEFLSFLDEEYPEQYGILTYGNPYWQRLKIAAVGLSHVPYLVVDSAHKARQIASWYNDTERQYILPSAFAPAVNQMIQSTHEMILVDDKRKAFDGMHEATRGYWVSPAGPGDDILQETGYVQKVSGLLEIIEHETGYKVVG